MWYRIISISHLPMLIFICHTSTHCSILNISLLISRHSLMVFAFLYNVAPSAFEIVFELHTFSHKYLIYKRKTNDPNTVPWGIPLLKIYDIETFESISTCCIRLHRKSSNHSNIDPPIPKKRNS